MNKLKRCEGCGSILQTKDKTKEGYIPENKYEDSKLCQRCFKLKHYSSDGNISINHDEYLHSIKLDTSNNTIIYVIDAFNFYGSLNEVLKSLSENNDLIILINKIDVLPKSLNLNKYYLHIKKALEDEGIKYDDFIILSTKNNYGFDDLIHSIDSYKSKNVYLMGNANVGKSTIINKLLKDYKGNKDGVVTTSYFPGTTLQLIKIPFLNGKFLYDTPGVYNPNNFYNVVNAKNLKYLLPNKEIKPISITLRKNNSLYLGSLVRIDYLDGDEKPMIVYTSFQTKLNRSRLDEKEEVKFNKALNNPLYYPKGINLNSKDDFKVEHLDLSLNKRTSVWLNGLGFIDLLKGKVKLDIYLPKSVNIIVKDSFIGGD